MKIRKYVSTAGASEDNTLNFLVGKGKTISELVFEADFELANDKYISIQCGPKTPLTLSNLDLSDKIQQRAQANVTGGIYNLYRRYKLDDVKLSSDKDTYYVGISVSTVGTGHFWVTLIFY